MKWPPARTILALAVFLGVAGFCIGGIVSAVQGTTGSDSEFAQLSELLAFIAGGVVGAVVTTSRNGKDGSE